MHLRSEAQRRHDEAVIQGSSRREGDQGTTILTDDDFVRLFQRSAGLRDDGWAGLDTIAKLDALVPAPQARTDIPDDYWPMLAQIESGKRPYIKAPTSSCSRLYHFINATWIGQDVHREERGVPAEPRHANHQGVARDHPWHDGWKVGRWRELHEMAGYVPGLYEATAHHVTLNGAHGPDGGVVMMRTAYELRVV